MTILFAYLALALVFSFLCSIAEAVLLSVTTAYISVMEEEGKPAASLLRQFKSDIDAPLAAILSLNTIAHTIGAAGVGAQAAHVFGNNYLGIISAVLTLLILVFSEIIPKTLGSVYWRSLAPGTAYALKYLVFVLAPLVWLSKMLTSRLTKRKSIKGFSRDEFSAMAKLGEQEGQLAEPEARILRNLFALRELKVETAMTPKSVMFALAQSSTVEHFFHRHDNVRFSRIPLMNDSNEEITGFVLRSDLLLAQARGNGTSKLAKFKREIQGVVDKVSMLQAFELFLENRAQIMYVLNEYGSVKGLLTLEDILETLMGLEIVDEGDAIDDMQRLAKRRWLKKASEMGIDVSKF